MKLSPGARANATTGDTAWTAPTLVNSWANAAPTTAGYRKDAEGYVHLTGKIGAGTAGATAFTLPAGYRPHQESDFPVSQWTGARALTHVRVNADGTVVPAATGDWVDLATISFHAA